MALLSDGFMDKNDDISMFSPFVRPNSDSMAINSGRLTVDIENTNTRKVKIEPKKIATRRVSYLVRKRILSQKRVLKETNNFALKRNE